ncbi:hypothetical protein C4H11_11670 [Bacteroides zoogleoformans]|uniref:Fimbrillin-like protein n=2 Tax=Bacteroides zoogleoformans TaxID=28119 RepID=A0ABN5IL21_9BACE|nr:hypothetical protein C4H11_11670 [Bacteroides zoogleoformans]
MKAKDIQDMKTKKREENSKSRLYHLRLAAGMAAFAWLLWSCADEERTILPAPPAKTADVCVTLSVTIPGMRTPTATRSTDDSKPGFPLTVLGFKVEDGTEKLTFMKVFATAAEAGAPIVYPEEDKYAMTLIGMPEGDYNRLCICCATDATGLLTPGTSVYDDVKTMDLNGCMNAAGIYNRPALPMYGELKAAAENGIALRAGISQVFNRPGQEVKFLRAMARIDVTKKLDANRQTFTLEEVYFCRGVEKGRIYGDKDTYTTTQNLPAGTLAPMADAAYGTISGTGATQQLDTPIYAWENDFTGDNRPRVVVKGNYRGETQYYPLDFVDNQGRPIPIRRNHRYKFIIKEVGARGYDTAAEALASAKVFTNRKEPPSVELVVVPEDYLSVVYNEDDFLAVSQSGFIFFKEGPHTETSTGNKLKIKTDFAGGWTLKAYNVDGTEIAPSGWLGASSVSSGGVPGETEISILNDGAKTRAGYLKVIAGRLEARIQVLQVDKLPLEFAAEYNLAGGRKYGSRSYYDSQTTAAQTNEEVGWSTSNDDPLQSGYYNGYVLRGEQDDTYNSAALNIFDDEFFTTGAGAGYHLPSREEWGSVFVPLHLFKKQGSLREAVTFGGINFTCSSRYKHFYGVRFLKDDLSSIWGGVDGTSLDQFPQLMNNRMACAYRYILQFQGSRKVIVQCVYIGYLSPMPTLLNIANENWWDYQALIPGNVVTREFPLCGYLSSAAAGGTTRRKGISDVGELVRNWSATPYGNRSLWNVSCSQGGMIRVGSSFDCCHTVRLFSDN